MRWQLEWMPGGPTTDGGTPAPRDAGGAAAQIAAVVAVALGWFLATARVVFDHLRSEQTDGRIVNIAGRQRMLSQRIARQALEIGTGREGVREDLAATISEFGSALHDLREGAPSRGLPPASPAGRRHLARVEQHWETFAEAATTLRRTPRADPAFAPQLGRVCELSDLLLDESERTVAHFDATFSDRVLRLRRRMTVTGAVGAVVLTATAGGMLAAANRRTGQARREVARKEHALAEIAEERRDLVRQLLSAHEEERRRVASDIHDGPTQQLVGAAMFLEAARNGTNGTGGTGGTDAATTATADPREAEQRRNVELAASYLDAALMETRRIIADLRPPLLDDLGVAEALRRSASGFADERGAVLTVEGPGRSERPGPEVETVLFRIAQEAINNALRHSGTDRVAVTLTEDASGITLRVRDWGSGFDPARVAERDGHRPVGLLGMRERAELVGGWLEVRSGPSGTTIEAWVPEAAVLA